MAAVENAATVDANDLKLLHSFLGSLLSAVAAAIADAAEVSIVLRSLHPLASLFFSVPVDIISGKLCLKFIGGSVHLISRVLCLSFGI